MPLGSTAERIALDTKAPYSNCTWRALLISERERTAIGPAALLRGRSDKPPGLNVRILAAWLDGNAEQANRSHVEYALHCWKAVSPAIPVTAALRKQLKNYRKQTGVGPVLLLKIFKDAPNRLTPTMVAAWMQGSTKTARQDHVDFVLGAWRELKEPKDKLPVMPRSRRYQPRSYDDRYALFPGYLEKIRQEFERTGISYRALLEGTDDLPKGLSYPGLQNWLQGATKTAPAAHQTYVLEKLKALPDKAPQSKAPKASGAMRPGYELIQATHVEEIRRLRKATRISPGDLLRRTADRPSLLSDNMIKGWLNGQIESADPADITFVLSAYRDLIN